MSGQAGDAKPLVIHVGPDPAGRGGMASVIATLLASPLAERYELRMVTTHRVGSARARLAVFARALAELRRTLRAHDAPCVVHIHSAARGSLHRKAIMAALARRHGAAVVLHLHTGPGDMSAFIRSLDPARRALFARELRHVDLCLTASAATALEVERAFGTTAADLLDNPLPGPLPRDPAISRAHGVPAVLFLGGFANPVKGGAILIEALEGLEVDEMSVTLAGPGEPPPGADGVGRWAGWLDEAAKDGALRAADIVVLPSTSEGLPVALLEAMAHGKAVIASDVGSIAVVVDDGACAVLVPPGDPLALRAALAALAADGRRRATLGARARERASAFTPQQIAERLDAHYRELLSIKGGHV